MQRVVGVAVLLTAASLAVAVTGRSAGGAWQTQLMVTLTAGQLGVALALRPPGAWSRSAGRSTLWLPLTVGVGLLLLMAAVYLPGLSAVVGTEGLTAAELGTALVAGLVPGTVLWGVRTVSRITGRGRQQRG